MKRFVFVLLASLLVGCFVPYAGSNYTKVDYSNKYVDKLEPGSTPVDAGYDYSVEKTADGKFVKKVYFPETRQLTQFITYTDKTLNVATGPTREWWDDGSLWFEGDLSNGKRIGEFTIWNDGNVSKGKYVNGSQEGLWLGLDSLGNKRSEMNFTNGKRNGSFKIWNEEGKLVRQGTYKDNELEKEEKFEDNSPVPLVFKEVDVQPYFSGCETQPKEEKKKCAETKMLQFIYSNIKYPPMARENGIQGTAYLTFVVEKDGSVTNIKTKRGIINEIQNECERVLRLMPKWEPGYQDGKPVRVIFNIPVKFKLE